MNNQAANAPSKGGIIALPTELKDAIAVYLSPRDLINFYKTCRTLRSVMLPALVSALYKNVIVTDIDFQIPLLLQTVLDQPRRAECIQSIQLDGDIPYLQKGSSYQAEIDALSASLSLLFAHCPRLESLIVDYSIVEHLEINNRAERIQGKPILQIHTTQRLIVRCPHLATYTTRDKFEADIRAIMPFWLRALLYLFELPNLHHLEIPLLADSDVDGINLAKLRTLRLCHTYAKPKLVQLLLHDSAYLEELFYDLVVYREGPVSAAALGRALRCVQSTLARLTIRLKLYHRNCYWGEIDPVLPHGVVLEESLGSLREFPALTSLNISPAVLYGTGDRPSEQSLPLGQMLPPTLESLVINDDWWENDDFLAVKFVGEILPRFVQADWKNATPLLENFTLDLRREGRTFAGDVREMLQDMGDIKCRLRTKKG